LSFGEVAFVEYVIEFSKATNSSLLARSTTYENLGYRNRNPTTLRIVNGQNGKEVIYLTKKGRARYALVPLDEGDEEVLAIRRNTRLMRYLDKAGKSARKGPRKTLEEIKRMIALRKRPR
jgi:hypothetical protein